MRILMWLGLALLVFFALRKQVRAKQKQNLRPDFGDASRATTSEQMVACAVCQVFIPRSEAIERDGEVFCCPDHANQAKSSR